MNLAERINQRMTTLQLTQADIARGIGVSAPTVHDWCSGDIKVLKSQNMKKLAASAPGSSGHTGIGNTSIFRMRR